MTNLDAPLPVSVKDLDRFTPPACRDFDPKPVLLLRAPGFTKRAQIRNNINAAGLRWRGDDEFFDLMREAVRHASPPNQDQVLDVIDRMAQARVSADDMDQSERRSLERDFQIIQDICRVHSEAFARAQADRLSYLELAPVMALRSILEGVEGIDITLPRDGAGLTMAAVDNLAEELGEDGLAQAASRALSLVSLTDRTRKNSASPSPPPSNPKPLQVADRTVEMTAEQSAEMNGTSLATSTS
jgi:hypothetical protein